MTNLFATQWLQAIVVCLLPSVFAGLEGLTSTPRLAHHAWTNARVQSIAGSLNQTLEQFRNSSWQSDAQDLDEIREALLWATYPKPVTHVAVVAYADKSHGNLELLKETAPFAVSVICLTNNGEWRGTFDKFNGYLNYVTAAGDDDIIVFVDAFDVFGNGFDGHEMLRRYFSFNRPIVFAAEENIFPREVEGDALLAIQALGLVKLLDDSAPSRFLNAGGIIGVGWAMKRMFRDIRENMVANAPEMLQAHADIVGHWFLHAYDQYEMWRFFIRHSLAIVQGEEPEMLIALDTDQFIFGSTVFNRDNWLGLMEGAVSWNERTNATIDIDVPLIFDAPQSCFEIRKCRARFVGREHFPIFWHGHGPFKKAWEDLRNRLRAQGCFPSGGVVVGSDDLNDQA